MKDFWDARAREDPFYFVDNRLQYGNADLERLWQSGREELDLMLGLLNVQIKPTDETVEVGCGVGRMTRVIAERSAGVVAIDISERMLDVARELNPQLENVRWMLGDGVSLNGIDDESVDVCQSYVVFHHIPDPEITLGYIGEIGRVLRPGGWAAAQISNQPAKHLRQPFRRRLKFAWRALRKRGPRGQNHAAWRGSSIDLDRLRAVAGEAGMTLERVVGEGQIYCLVLLRKLDPIAAQK